jgi:hypothetical protein
MRKKPASVRIFRVHSLFHLQIVEFDATVPLQYQLKWQRPWFSNIPTEKKIYTIQVR